MTRKEEIKTAARLYSPNNAHHTADTFEYGAEWADKTMIARVCKFIEENAYKYGKVKFVNDNKATFDFRTDIFIESLRKAMEE